MGETYKVSRKNIMEIELKIWVFTGREIKKIYRKSYLQREAVWKSRILAKAS